MSDYGDEGSYEDDGGGYDESYDDRGSYRSSHHSQSDRSSHHAGDERRSSHHSDSGNGSENAKEEGGGGGGGFMQAAAGGLMGGAAGGWLSNKMAKMKLNKEKKEQAQGGGSGGGGQAGYGHGGGSQGYGGYQGYPGGGGDQRDLYQNQYNPPPPGPPQGYYPSGAGYNPGMQPQYAPQPPPQQYGGQHFHQADGREQGQVKQYFEYSTCQGNRKALLIGINYFGQSGELAGCINDAQNVKQFLCERFGYRPADIVMLTDDANDPRSIPTKANIIKAMGWLVAGAQKDDSLFFHYSGHGTQTEDLDGDEGDDDDEAICPLDYHEAGLIIDDDSERLISSHDMLVKPLPAGCRLTAIFDSCHSGTVMDLPYVYTTDGKIKEPNLLAESGDDLMSAGVSLLTGNTAGAMSSLFGAAKGAFEMNRAHEKTKKTKTSPADVIMWSGCKDDQTSADTQEEGAATGAMSYAFISSLRKYPQQSYQQLLQTIREELRGKYSQKPQLSACHPIDVDLEFVA